jgi:Ca-activated chloride channel family protein
VTHARVNHIILITDGRTYGDEEKCLSLALRAADQGVGISGLGIGPEWNDNFLDELTATTGGSSMFVSRAQDIQKSLLEKFNRLGSAYADETRLEFTIPEGVELRYAFRIQPEPGVLSGNSPLMLGPILDGNSLKVLMEFVIQPQPQQPKAITLFEGKLWVTLADEGSPKKPLPIRLNRPVTDDSGVDIPTTEILNALSRLRLYRLMEQAKLEVSAGDFAEASKHMHRLASHLLSQGERGLARTVLMEVEHIQNTKSLSQQGGKEIKYGTRALVSTGRNEEE